MQQGRELWVEVMNRMSELAKHVGLHSGEMSLTVSQGMIVTVEARPVLRIRLMRHRQKEWQGLEEVFHVEMKEAEQCLTDDFQGNIIALVGKFGSVAADFQRGELVVLRATENRRPPFGAPRRRRRRNGKGASVSV